MNLIGRVTYINALGNQIEQYFGRHDFVSSLEPTRLKKVIPGADNPERFRDLEIAAKRGEQEQS